MGPRDWAPESPRGLPISFSTMAWEADTVIGLFAGGSAPAGFVLFRGGPHLIGGSVKDVFVEYFITQQSAETVPGFDFKAVEGFGRGGGVLT